MAKASPKLSLGEAWLLAIRDGRITVTDACEWSRIRVDEGGADPIVQALARCTSERALSAWVSKQPWRQALPEAYSFKAPVRHHDGGVSMETLHCMLPHDMVAHIFKGFPKVAEELFGTPAQRKDFWGELDRTARELPAGPRAAEHRRWVRSHPAFAGSHPASRLALGIHGDAGQMHWGREDYSCQLGRPGAQGQHPRHQAALHGDQTLP